MKQLLDYQDGEKFFVFHFNCWQYDYYEEPLIAIVAAMLDSVDQETHIFSQSLREKAKQGMAFAKPVLEKIAKTSSARRSELISQISSPSSTMIANLLINIKMIMQRHMTTTNTTLLGKL